MTEAQIESLEGISFYNLKTRSKMRYIYPDTKHWCAGWIVRQTKGGQWETYRKATDEDVAELSQTIVKAHHGDLR